MLKTPIPLYAYVYESPAVHGDRILLSSDQLAAFIMAHQTAPRTVVTDIFDQFFLDTYQQYIGSCTNREFLINELLPELIPMQQGKVKPPEFKPLTEEQWTELAKKSIQL